MAGNYCKCNSCGFVISVDELMQKMGLGGYKQAMIPISQCIKCRSRDIEITDKAPSRGGGCFIATAVFDSYDSPEVVKLRCFRDHCLSRYAIGRSFISFYYKIGPFLASGVKKMPVLKQLLKRFLKLFL